MAVGFLSNPLPRPVNLLWGGAVYSDVLFVFCLHNFEQWVIIVFIAKAKIFSGML